MPATRPAVLIVEPSASTRTRLGRGLRRLGYRVASAQTATEASTAALEPGSAVVALLDGGVALPDRLDRLRTGIEAAGARMLGAILTVDMQSGAPALPPTHAAILDLVSKRCPIAELDIRLRLAQVRSERAESSSRPTPGMDWELQALFDAVPFPLYIKNTRHQFAHANRAYLEHFNVSNALLLGRTFADLPGRTATEAESVWNVEAQVLATGTAVMTGDVPERDGAGQLRTFWNIVIPLRDEKQQVTGMIGMMEDVTERRQTTERLRESEATLRQAQRIAHIANWSWHVPSNQVAWCEEIYRIFGFDPAHTAPSMEALIAAVHPNDREAVRSALHRAAAEGRDYRSDHRIVLPDGGERYLHEQGQVFCDEHGQPARMLGVVMDVTERMAAEHERTRLVTAVEQAGDAIFITDTEGQHPVREPSL